MQNDETLVENSISSGVIEDPSELDPSQFEQMEETVAKTEESSAAASSDAAADLSDNVALLSDISAQLEALNTTYLSTNVYNIFNSVVDRYWYKDYFAYQDKDSISHLYIGDAEESGGSVYFDDYVYIQVGRESYNSYYYYNVSSGSGAYLSTDSSIVYTNVLDNYPVLGTSGNIAMYSYLLMAAIVVIIGSIVGTLFHRRR